MFFFLGINYFHFSTLSPLELVHFVQRCSSLVDSLNKGINIFPWNRFLFLQLLYRLNKISFPSVIFHFGYQVVVRVSQISFTFIIATAEEWPSALFWWKTTSRKGSSFNQKTFIITASAAGMVFTLFWCRLSALKVYWWFVHNDKMPTKFLWILLKQLQIVFRICDSI